MSTFNAIKCDVKDCFESHTCKKCGGTDFHILSECESRDLRCAGECKHCDRNVPHGCPTCSKWCHHLNRFCPLKAEKSEFAAPRRIRFETKLYSGFRAAGIILVNMDMTKVLVQMGQLSRKGLPGGEYEGKNTPFDEACRELNEEAGLNILGDDYIFEYVCAMRSFADGVDVIGFVIRTDIKSWYNAGRSRYEVRRYVSVDPACYGHAWFGLNSAVVELEESVNELAFVEAFLYRNSDSSVLLDWDGARWE
jgi:hypothetical protein